MTEQTSHNTKNICMQLRKIQLFNIPPPRFNLISPYPANTQNELDMRRKAEILKYNSNSSSSQTNNLTKKQKWAQMINSSYKTNPVCPMIKTPTSSSDVPGPIILLYHDDSIPLYNYINNNRSYSSQNPTNNETWLSSFIDSVKIQNDTIIDTVIGSIYIITQPPHYNYTITTPFSIHIDGSYNDTLSNIYINISNVLITGKLYINSTIIESNINISVIIPSVKIDISNNNNNNGLFSFDYCVGSVIISNIVFPETVSLDTTVYDIGLNMTMVFPIETGNNNYTIFNRYFNLNIPIDFKNKGSNCIIPNVNNIITPVNIITTVN